MHSNVVYHVSGPHILWSKPFQAKFYVQCDNENVNVSPTLLCSTFFLLHWLTVTETHTHTYSMYFFLAFYDQIVHLTKKKKGKKNSHKNRSLQARARNKIYKTHDCICRFRNNNGLPKKKVRGVFGWIAIAVEQHQNHRTIKRSNSNFGFGYRNVGKW